MTTTSPAPAAATAPAAGRRHRARRVIAVALALLALMMCGALWSVAVGPTGLSLAAVLHGLAHAFGAGGSTTDEIVRTVRLPRTEVALLVGAGTAVGGLITQSITANPLAAPEILGVNAGAAIVAAAAVAVVPALAGAPVVALAFIGAAATGIVVFLLAGGGGGRTGAIRLVLAGFTVTTLLLSLTQGIIIFHDNSTDAVFFWLVGGVNFVQARDVVTVLPWIIIGLLAAFALATKLDVLALGEDVARGLGERVQWIRGLGALVVIILAGSCVAVAGPIAFVGLITPHIVRRLIGGGTHRTLIPLCAIAGATLLTFADVISRYIDPPTEVPAGVLTALIGAPVFVFLARRQKGIG